MLNIFKLSEFHISRFCREGDRVVSVGGREPTSVEEAVEGIRLGGRTVHILVGFGFRFMEVENKAN